MYGLLATFSETYFHSCKFLPCRPFFLSKAFPALRLFKKREAQTPDYRSDRTLEAMLEYVKATLVIISYYVSPPPVFNAILPTDDR